MFEDMSNLLEGNLFEKFLEHEIEISKHVCFKKWVFEKFPAPCWCSYRLLVNVPCQVCWREGGFRTAIDGQLFSYWVSVTGQNRDQSTIRTSLSVPVFCPQNFWSIKWDNNNQQIPKGTICGKHWALFTHFTSITPSAPQREAVEGDLVYAGLSDLKLCEESQSKPNGSWATVCIARLYSHQQLSRVDHAQILALLYQGGSLTYYIRLLCMNMLWCQIVRYVLTLSLPPYLLSSSEGEP